ncbi:MAG: PIN domain-containing protein [Nanoarchaeota archaeon]
MKMLIVLDTNFLIYAVRYKIDIKSELERIANFTYEVVVPSQVFKELQWISKRKIKAKGKDREAAAVALLLIKDFKIIETHAESVDNACLELAEGNCLATLDADLRKRFKKGKILVIKQKKYLSFIR